MNGVEVIFETKRILLPVEKPKGLLMPGGRIRYPTPGTDDVEKCPTCPGNCIGTAEID